jgi:hypothetical protein
MLRACVHEVTATETPPLEPERPVQAPASPTTSAPPPQGQDQQPQPLAAAVARLAAPALEAARRAAARAAAPPPGAGTAAPTARDDPTLTRLRGKTVLLVCGRVSPSAQALLEVLVAQGAARVILAPRDLGEGARRGEPPPWPRLLAWGKAVAACAHQGGAGACSFNRANKSQTGACAPRPTPSRSPLRTACAGGPPPAAALTPCRRRPQRRARPWRRNGGIWGGRGFRPRHGRCGRERALGPPRARARRLPPAGRRRRSGTPGARGDPHPV